MEQINTFEIADLRFTTTKESGRYTTSVAHSNNAAHPFADWSCPTYVQQYERTQAYVLHYIEHRDILAAFWATA